MRASLLIALVACGAANRTPSTIPHSDPDAMEDLRQRAHDAPQDAALWRELAEAEFLGAAGDAARARPAIDHAIQLASSDAELRLLSAWEHNARGKLDEALTDYIAAVENAKRDRGPLSPFIAETALDDIEGLRGGVANFDTRTRPLLESVLSDPGTLGFYAVDAVAQRLMNSARRSGQKDVVDQTADLLGCLREWRTVGPFGPYVNASFDTRVAAEAPGPLADKYDLGPGIGEEETEAAKHLGCNVDLNVGEHRGGGSTIAETFVEVEHAGEYVLAIESGGSLKVYWDGELVQEVDRRRRFSSRYATVPLQVSAGRHELEVKVTGSSNLTATLERNGSRGADYDATRGLRLPEGEDLLTTLIRTNVLHGRSNPVAAREAIAPLRSNEASAEVLRVLAIATDRDPFLPGPKKEEALEALYQRILQRDPNSAFIALQVAQRSQGDREYFEAVREVAQQWPDVAGIQLAWASALQRRGQLREAEQILVHTRELLPGDCGPIARLRELFTERSRVHEANALVEPLMACDQSSHARLQLLMRQRDWDAAQQEIDRLAPLLRERQSQNLKLSLAVARGDRNEEARLRVAIDDDAENSGQRTRQSVDRLMARGDTDEAIALLDAEASTDPEALHGLRDLRRDLTGRDEFEQYRVDGATIIEQYEASGQEHEAAQQVLVFDYMVTRVYPSGASRHLVHQIFRVQSEQSKQQLGQISLPGRLLTLRSIKPDGRHVEPETISGLDSIPMTDLAIGDYVEYEYITTQGPRINGGFLSAGWVFDAFDQPFDVSKMVVVFPASMTLDVEALGPVPNPTTERRGDLKVMTWLVEDNLAREPEPHAIPRPPFRPTLRFGVNATWDVFFKANYSAMLGRDPVDPAAVRLARQIVAEARTDRAKVRRIFDWVMENVEVAANWNGVAPAMLAARHGDPTRLIRYLAELAGLRAELVMSRSSGALEPSTLSRAALYGSGLVRIGGPNGFYVWAGERSAPWDYLPAPLRGQQAVVLNGELESVTLPDPGIETDLRERAVEVHLQGERGATLRVTETNHGSAAIFWRSRLRTVPAADLERLLAEAYVSRVVPGASVESIAVSGIEDRAEPLRIQYEVEVADYGRSVGDARLLPPIAPEGLAQNYATLASRTTTELVPGHAVRTTLRVHDARIAGTYENAELRGPGGMLYARQVERIDEGVQVTRTLRIPRSEVVANQYPEFANFCRQTTELESAPVPVKAR